MENPESSNQKEIQEVFAILNGLSYNDALYVLNECQKGIGNCSIVEFSAMPQDSPQ